MYIFHCSYICKIWETRVLQIWHDLQQTSCLCLSVASFVYEINTFHGSTIYLPCNVPQFNQIPANALWYKETSAGQRVDFREGASGEMKPMQQLYPLDQDQSVILRNVVTEDSGIYHCEFPKGEKLSTVRVTVKGRLTAPLLHFYLNSINYLMIHLNDNAVYVNSYLYAIQVHKFLLFKWSHLWFLWLVNVSSPRYF